MSVTEPLDLPLDLGQQLAAARRRMPLPSDAAGDLLTTKEVAEFWRVTPETVSRWYRTGHLRGEKIGPRTLRFRRSDVEALGRGPEQTEAASA